MNFECVPVTRLHPDQIRLWTFFQEKHPGTDSPFLSPGFAQAVADQRDDVEVAVMRDGGRSVGFLPFHRDASRVGRPIGMRLSDLQGAVADDGVDWDAEQLIRECGLNTWRFSHLLADQRPFSAFHWGEVQSPFIDLAGGFEAYSRERRQAGSRLLSQVQRKARKLEREVGQVQFQWHTLDRAVFDTLLRWKSEQRRMTGSFDVLSLGWVVRLLDRLRVTQSDEMTGVLSALHVNDRLAAAHLGLRGRHTFHVWFPVFNPELRPYSPGLILMVEMIKACAREGIAVIHLGKGVQQYKLSFMSGALSLATGCVARPGMITSMSSAWFKTRQWLSRTPLRGPAQLSKRLLQRWPQRTAMR